LEAEGFVLEGQRGVDPLPAGGLEAAITSGRTRALSVLVVDEQRVAYIAAEDVDRELAVESGAVQKMRDQVVAIGVDIELGSLMSRSAMRWLTYQSEASMVTWPTR